MGERGPAACTDPLLPSGFDAHFSLMPTPGWGQQRSQAECHRHCTRNNGHATSLISQQQLSSSTALTVECSDAER